MCYKHGLDFQFNITVCCFSHFRFAHVCDASMDQAMVKTQAPRYIYFISLEISYCSLFLQRWGDIFGKSRKILKVSMDIRMIQHLSFLPDPS